MKEFEKPENGEPKEINPELQGEAEQFEEKVGEIADEIEKVDPEEVEDGEVEELGHKIRITLVACAMIAGVEAMVSSALLDIENMKMAANIMEKIGKGIMSMGGIGAILVSNKSLVSLENAFEGWQKIVTIRRKKKEPVS